MRFTLKGSHGYKVYKVIPIELHNIRKYVQYIFVSLPSFLLTTFLLRKKASNV